MNVVFFGGPRDRQQLRVSDTPAAIYWHGYAWAFDISAHQHWVAMGYACQGIYYLSIRFNDSILYLWNAVE